MKKTLLFAAFVSAVAVSALADVITPSQAVAIASEFVGTPLSPASSGSLRTHRGKLATETAPLYVVPCGEDQGWVLVSGNDALPAVLGYADHGNFDADDMSPAYRDMLDAFAAEATAATEAGLPARAPRRAPSRASISPLITTHWHQNSPYNDMCPFITGTNNRAVTGCVATAAAQIIYYFRRDLPRTLQARTPTYSYGDAPVTESLPKGTRIEYDLMFNDYKSSIPADMRQLVATFVYAVGTASYLTYGSSTGGQISDANKAMQSHFGLGGSVVWRGGTSMDSWETTLYNSLSAAKPILYSGYTEDDSGHAIVMDGYNANNGLWHFNFGWGGQGDGWYTLEAETGVNGYGRNPGVVLNITPKQQGATAHIRCDTLFTARAYNDAVITFTNTGTLPANGFNVYLSGSTKAPSASTAANVSDNTTIAPGETAIVPVRLKPTMADRIYTIYVTDKKCNVVAERKVFATTPAPDLTLLDLDADFSAVRSEGLLVFYGQSLVARATLSNSPAATAIVPTMEMKLVAEQLDDPAATFSPVTKRITKEQFESGETRTIEVDFSSGKLVPGIYALSLSSDIGYNNVIRMEGDSVVRFRLVPSDLQLVSSEGRTAVFAGHWCAADFKALATDPYVTIYDLTAVSGVAGQPVAANANAVFYVGADADVSTGANLVRDGECRQLSLVYGPDFLPRAPFHAATAQFAAPNFLPGVWNMLALPFDCQRPDGFIVRRINAIAGSSISEVEAVAQWPASSPVQVMADSYTPAPFCGTDVMVSASADTAQLSSFVTDFAAMTAPANTFVLDTDPEAVTPYFNVADSGACLMPFTPALVRADGKKTRAVMTIDRNYRNLARAVADAALLRDSLGSAVTADANAALDSLLAAAHAMGIAQAEESSTPITKLVKDINAMMELYPLAQKRFIEPMDFTPYITNPSFETGNKSGWKSDTSSSVRDLSNLTSYAVGTAGTHFLYSNKSNASTELSQTITGLPTGWYRLSAMVGTADEGVVTLFAGDRETVKAAPEWGKYYLEEAVVDSIWVESASGSDGELTIGIREGATWYKADAFTLQLIGRPVQEDDTAIATPMAEAPVRQGLYDLSGRPVANPADMLPGVIYIRDGRKVMRMR